MSDIVTSVFDLSGIFVPMSAYRLSAFHHRFMEYWQIGHQHHGYQCINYWHIQISKYRKSAYSVYECRIFGYRHSGVDASDIGASAVSSRFLRFILKCKFTIIVILMC